MTIDEAVTVLENEARVAEVNDRPLEVKAIKLGIEALKQIKYLHEIHILHDDELLPGETEEKVNDNSSR